MVDVDHQDQVHRAFGQLRVGRRAEDRLDVLDAEAGGILPEHLEHLRLDVGREDGPLRADPLRDFHARVADPCTDVGHGHPGLELERVKHPIGLLLGLARVADEPVGAVECHHVGDLAAHVHLRPGRGRSSPPRRASSTWLVWREGGRDREAAGQGQSDDHHRGAESGHRSIPPVDRVVSPLNVDPASPRRQYERLRGLTQTRTKRSLSPWTSGSSATARGRPGRVPPVWWMPSSGG